MKFLTKKNTITPFINTMRGVICFVLLLSGCASQKMIQPQINSLSSAGQYRSALNLMRADATSYGSKNELLYCLDFGLLAHWAKSYNESVSAFEKAKRIYDDLYTVSISNELSTWVMNDLNAPYRGEDFERVMINIFSALNFAQQENWDEALVEARDVDNRLKLFNQKYPEKQKNSYREDAWARFLMGLIYEARGSRQDLEDAYIEYKRAIEIYSTDFKEIYSADIPKSLKENFLSLQKYLGRQETDLMYNFSSAFPSYEQRANNAEVYVVQYDGLSPIKTSFTLVLPLPGGIVGQIAFPQYTDRLFDSVDDPIKAINPNGSVIQSKQTEITEDISAIAKKSLDDRKTRVIAKAAFRATGKYVAEAILQSQIERKSGDVAAAGFGILSSIFNLASEQPDLRSWQTLPATIRIAKLELSPGQYSIYAGDKMLSDLNLSAGQKKFIYFRTLR